MPRSRPRALQGAVVERHPKTAPGLRSANRGRTAHPAGVPGVCAALWPRAGHGRSGLHASPRTACNGGLDGSCVLPSAGLDSRARIDRQGDLARAAEVVNIEANVFEDEANLK